MAKSATPTKPASFPSVAGTITGAGRSPGYLDPFSPRETKDFYNCIEWAAQQEWSNGKIGLNGISYYAINQWQVAELQPPNLAAMSIWEGAHDLFRE
ncbi:MAG: CocE/NonD family hydrolase, partial [Gammaproteobacteria bacterium]|nr:CocE/NonD family hydrolase [Gammaproteobacteria bacterium]